MFSFAEALPITPLGLPGVLVMSTVRLFAVVFLLVGTSLSTKVHAQVPAKKTALIPTPKINYVLAPNSNLSTAKTAPSVQPTPILIANPSIAANLATAMVVAGMAPTLEQQRQLVTVSASLDAAAPAMIREQIANGVSPQDAVIRVQSVIQEMVLTSFYKPPAAVIGVNSSSPSVASISAATVSSSQSWTSSSSSSAPSSVSSTSSAKSSTYSSFSVVSSLSPSSASSSYSMPSSSSSAYSQPNLNTNVKVTSTSSVPMDDGIGNLGISR